MLAKYIVLLNVCFIVSDAKLVTIAFNNRTQGMVLRSFVNEFQLFTITYKTAVWELKKIYCDQIV